MKNESTPLERLTEAARTVEIPFPLVPQEASKILNEKEEFDYRSARKEFARWLLLKGKNPRDVVGYSEATAKKTMYRVGYFERFVWELEGEYTPFPTREHADVVHARARVLGLQQLTQTRYATLPKAIFQMATPRARR